MKSIKVIIVILILASCQDQKKAVDSPAPPKDPLPSWNEGNTKQSIIDFIGKITREGSSGFIPVEDRIATFDNDGTLWAERPYVQELFAFYRVKKLVEKEPNLAKKQPFKAVIEHDNKYLTKGGEKALIELMMATHTGMSEDEFDADATDFFATAKFPGRNVPIRQVRYQPQLELLEYLRNNGFKIFICTGGTQEFVRAIAMEYYGVPREQVIGTTFKYVYADSSKKIYRQPALDHFNDKEGKPVSIQLYIGKKPVFACGNEGGRGDIAMLSYTSTNKYPSLALLINHDDASREFAYNETDSASLKAAAKGHWLVVSIRNDWKEVYAPQ